MQLKYYNFRWNNASSKLPDQFGLSFIGLALSVFLDDSGRFHQHIYAQLLCTQIPKAQKADWIYCLFALLGFARVKAARKMLVKLTSRWGYPREQRCKSRLSEAKSRSICSGLFSDNFSSGGNWKPMRNAYEKILSVKFLNRLNRKKCLLIVWGCSQKFLANLQDRLI